MEFSIKRPPLVMDINSIHLFTLFFSFAIESYIMKRILHLVSVKNTTFTSYNLFKIDRLLRPLTAIFSPVQSHLNYYTHII